MKDTAFVDWGLLDIENVLCWKSLLGMYTMAVLMKW